MFANNPHAWIVFLDVEALCRNVIIPVDILRHALYSYKLVYLSYLYFIYDNTYSVCNDAMMIIINRFVIDPHLWITFELIFFKVYFHPKLWV